MAPNTPASGGADSCSETRSEASANDYSTEYVRVTFHPQIWHDKRAVTSDDLEEYQVPAEDATDEDGNLLPDNSRESDALRTHENAPDRASNWQGPFYVTLEWADTTDVPTSGQGGDSA